MAVYDPSVIVEVLSAIPQDPRLVCLVVYGYPLPAVPVPVPTIVFLPSGSADIASVPNLTVFKLDCPSPLFVLPQTVDFHTGAASISHSKAAVHFKKYVGGPCKQQDYTNNFPLFFYVVFDLEAIWEEHTYFEFELRSVAKTMGTMVVCYFILLTSFRH